MILAHKTGLDLNNKQKTYMAKACGAARFAYNWALHEWKSMYKLYKEDNSNPCPNEGLLRKKLNSIKRKEFPWMLDITKSAVQMAIIHLGIAYKRFFKKISKYPKPKKKGHHDSFTITNEQFKVKGDKLWIPKLGWVRLAEELRFDGKLMSATISRKAEQWFVSFQIEVSNEQYYAENQSYNGNVIGVDLGINTLATLSNGDKYQAPKPLKNNLKKLKQLQKNLSRKQKGSKNRVKARNKLAKLHLRISNIRNDCLNKLTTKLVEKYDIIVIENLNVKGMMSNHKLARAISDLGFYTFKSMLQYKAHRYGKQVIIADRYFASSKLCSDCGHKLESLPLSIREWNCPNCGCVHDRDINAAINLRNLAGSSSVIVCGESSNSFSENTLLETTINEAETKHQIMNEVI